MDDPTVEIQSPGVAVERLGRAVAVSWGLLAASVPTFVFTARPMMSIAGAAPIQVVWAFWASLVILLASAARLLAFRFDPARSARSGARAPGIFTVHAGEVTLSRRGGRQRRPLAEVTEGWIEPAGRITTAVLRLRSGDLWSIEVAGHEEGERLLRAAGVSVDQQVWRTRLANATTTVVFGGCLAAGASTILAIMLPALLFVVAQGVSDVMNGVATWTSIWKPMAWLAGTVFGFFFLVRALTPPLLSVGADGVSIRGFFRRRRFVPYAEVERADRRESAVVLTLVSGSRLVLPTGGGEEALGAAIHDRISRAMAARRVADAAGAVEALDRGARTPAVWREHLRALGRSAGDEGYRSLRVSPERIAAVLEDVASPPERRVAAALALSRVEDPSLRRRVQAAVSSCADEDLRATLEAAAADEIAEDELVALRARGPRRRTKD
jgi:hypothetical protein